MKVPVLIQLIAGLYSTVAPLFNRRNPKKIILTSFHGKGYRGNTKVLFEYLTEHDFFEPVWLSIDTKIVNRIRSKYGYDRAYLAHSVKGMNSLAQTAAVIFTHGTSDFPFLVLPRRALRIQTYHGLPTKRGEYLRPDSDEPPNWLHRKILEYRFRPITHFLSSSEQVTQLFSQRFSLEPEKFIETGYPMYDALMQKPRRHYSEYNFWPKAPESKFVILYAPTFRRLSKTQWFPFDDKHILDIAQFLEKNDALMALRAHPNEKLNTKKFTRISDRFVVADQKTIENVTDLLLVSNAIITDYSSIYLEGLLKDIPCIFLPYDLDTYERGFAYPYFDITPGPKVFDQKSFLAELENALKGAESYREHRKHVKDRFFSETDGKATEKIVSFLEMALRD